MLCKMFLCFVLFSFVSCDYIGMFPQAGNDTAIYADSSTTLTDSLPAYDSANLLNPNDSFRLDSSNISILTPATSVDTRNVRPAELVNFAQKLLHVPYRYASADPAQGFDCSGFITYVFNNFHISVPRSSIDFTNVGLEVPVNEAKQGDLILFTGTESDSSYITRSVGHMGIVTQNTDSLRFIHASSGKANGVTITPLNEYYLRRFVKVIRVFPD